MKTLSKFAASLVALALVVGFAPTALLAADTGTVEVTVTGQDGKPAANVGVRVAPPAGEKKKQPAAELADKADKGGKGDKAAKPVMTDDKGMAKLENVPVGEQTIMAMSKEAGVGKEKVTVEAGKTAKVSITLKPAPAKPAK